MCCVMYFCFIFNVYPNVEKKKNVYITCDSKMIPLSYWSIFQYISEKSVHILFGGKSIAVPLWGTCFITRKRRISFNSFWYCNKMHILRLKKISFALTSQLLNVEYIFQTNTNKRSMDMLWVLFWRGAFPLASKMC